MSKKGLSKEDVKGPDIFIQSAGKVSKIVYDNKTPIALFVCAIILAGVAVTGFDYYKDKKELESQSALYIVQSKYEKKMAEFEPSEKKEDKKPEQKTIDFEKDLRPFVDNYKSVFKEHKGTKGALMAANHAATILEEHGKVDEGLSLLEKASETIDSKELIDALTRMTHARLLEKNGKCEQAIKEWDQVIKESTLAYLHPDALLKKGLCQLTIGKKQEAQETYQIIKDDFADTAAGKSADRIFRELGES